MSNVIPTIQPLGISPKFPRVKAFLKSYRRGVSEEAYQDSLATLQRYASEGEGFVDGEFAGEPLYFGFSDIFFEMNVVYSVMQWSAVRAALAETAGWHQEWRRAVAYGYWAYRVELEKERDRSSRCLRNTMGNVADCLVLGWEDWAVDLAQRVYRGLDAKGVFGMFDNVNLMFFDYSAGSHPRTQIFVLRLIADWKGWPQRNWEKWVFDEPIFTALLEHWRTPDGEALKSLLVAACDRHTHESRSGTQTKNYDIQSAGYYYNPFEVLVVMRLRQLAGLENPIVKHVLMGTPLGKLPEPAPLYGDALLEAVLARVRSTHPAY